MKTSLAIFALLVGCGGSSAVNITKTVGAQGGTVSHSDGSGVTIPAGALTSNAMITVTSVNATAPTGTVIVGPAYDFGPAGTTFSTPVTITLPFTAGKIPSGKTSGDIIIFTAPAGSTQYTQLSTTVSGSTVQAQASHFTVFLPAVRLPTDGGSSDCIADCSPGSGGGCNCVSSSCGGHVVQLDCAQETTSSPLDCFCEVDGQTMPSPTPPPTSCDTAASFVQKCLAN